MGVLAGVLNRANWKERDIIAQTNLSAGGLGASWFPTLAPSWRLTRGCLAPCFALRRNQGLLKLKVTTLYIYIYIYIYTHTHIYIPLFVTPCQSTSSSRDSVDKIKNHKVGSVSYL